MTAYTKLPLYVGLSLPVAPLFPVSTSFGYNLVLADAMGILPIGLPR